MYIIIIHSFSMNNTKAVVFCLYIINAGSLGKSSSEGLPLRGHRPVNEPTKVHNKLTSALLWAGLTLSGVRYSRTRM